MTESKRQFFDGIASQWDSFEAPPQADGPQDEFAKLATAHKPSQILDVGCGTGILVPFLRKRNSSARIVELDFAEGMLAVNRAKHGSQVEYCCNDLKNADFADASFDCILCFNALPHMQIDAALEKLAALLQPAGRLAIGHLMGSAELNAFHASMQSPVAHDCLPPSTDLAEQLREAGLDVLQCEERSDWYFLLAQKPAKK